MKGKKMIKNSVYYFCFAVAFFVLHSVSISHLLAEDDEENGYYEDEDYEEQDREEEDRVERKEPERKERAAPVVKKSLRPSAKKGEREKLAESRLKENEVNAWLRQIEELKKQNNQAKINQLAAKVLNRDPDNMQVLLALGAFYLNRNKERLAKIIFNRVLEKKVHLDVVYNNLGVVALKEGNRGEAIEMFKKSLEQVRDKVAPSANLGAIYMTAYNYTQAADYLEVAWESKGRLPAVLFQNIGNNYALALAWTGKADQSVEVFEEIIDKEVTDPDIFVNYAIVRIRALETRDKDKVLELLDKAAFLDKTGQHDNKIRALKDIANHAFE